MKSLVSYYRFIILFFFSILSTLLHTAEGQGLIIEHPLGTTAAPWGFLEYLPVDYNNDPNKLFPVIIHLSGYGERGNGTTDLTKVTRHGPLSIVKAGKWPVLNQNGDPPAENFIIIGPQSSGGFYNQTKVVQLIDVVLNTYRGDPNRVYVLGLSAGGYGAWGVAGYYPDRIAAAIAISGSGRKVEGFACDWKNVPIWAFHGDADTQVGISGSINPINAVRSCVPVGVPGAKLTVYPGLGHNAWTRTYDLSGMGKESTDWDPFDMSIYDWLLQYSLGASQPTAEAGDDIFLNLPVNNTNLNGSGSIIGGTIVSYSWSYVSGPATYTLTNENNSTATLSDLVLGTYSFRLTVTDDQGQTATDDVSVTLNDVNVSPTVDVGEDIELTLPVNSIVIDGTAADIDGVISTYEWTQQSGPSTATLTGDNSSSLQATDLVEGNYVFRLTVTDNSGSTAFDEVNITVLPAGINLAPTANAGLDITINLPTNSITIEGSGSDPDGSIVSYLWEKYTGPSATIVNATNPTVTINDLVEGVYKFELNVTDNGGLTDPDRVQVTVLAGNQNPVADAGDDIQVILPTNSTTLTGSGSDVDGSIASYMWEQSTGPSTATLTNENTNSVSVSDLIFGSYNFKLTVTDDKGATGSDNIIVTVDTTVVNILPTANAGSDVSLTLPEDSVILTGSGSDPDGSIVSYRWTRVSGPSSYSFSGQTTSVLTVRDLVAGTYKFRLTVTDDSGDTDIDNIFVNVAPESVNQSPVADAGDDKTISLPTDFVLITGTGSDFDGTIDTLIWTQLSGPSDANVSPANVSDTVNSSILISDLLEGTYVFKLEVTDDKGAIDTDDVSVFVLKDNQVPIVNAGNDINRILPEDSVTIVGSAIDSDGTITSTEWVKVSGPSVNITVSSDTLHLTNLLVGTYEFKFSATDNDALVSDDNVKIFVTSGNVLPAVNAGSDITLYLPTSSLNISGSATDSDGTITATIWEQTSGDTVELQNETTNTLTVNGLSSGDFTFEFIATDDQGGMASDAINVTVEDSTTSQPPIANAGENLTITLPTNSVNIIGSGLDNDGSIVEYQWSKKSGPSATLANTNNATLSVSEMVEGTYIFRLDVVDNDGLSSSDEIQVVVNSAAFNQTPIANAGEDKTITLPINTITLFGSGYDPDGEIINYIWTQSSGPSIASLENDSSATFVANNLIEGEYQFNLKITDNDSASNDDIVFVEVLAQGSNASPVANAGSDLTLFLPTNTINITGSGSDTDGSIASYLWSKISGSGDITLSNTNTPILSVQNLVEGEYLFQLTVTDSLGADDSDQMKLNVFPGTTNQAPNVNAGQDLTLILPSNAVNILGEVNDLDGSIDTLLWTKTSGGSATLSNIASLNVSIADLIEDTYVFRLTATDNEGAKSFDEVKVSVLAEGANNAPIANAGIDINAKLPLDSLRLEGKGFDIDGLISTYAWDKIQGPSVTLTSLNDSSILLTNLNSGLYIYQLQVTDDEGASDTDQISITILPESSNLNPTADAGEDVFADINDGPITFNGIANDEDGNIEEYLWEKTEGGDITMENANTASLTVENYSDDRYIFRFTVTDDNDAVATDVVELRISSDPPPAPPIAIAGEDVTIVQPDSTYTLAGAAESENIIQLYVWQQLSGPNLTGFPVDSSHVLLNFSEKGIYVFNLTVNDNLGMEGTDQVIITYKDNLTSNDFPKLFSPNGDGINDIWLVDDLDRISDCQLTIFDRYGKKIFEANPYVNNWDGTIGGVPVEAGAYYYIFNCSSGENISGGIRIIK